MHVTDEMMKKLLIQSSVATEDQVEALRKEATTSSKSLQDIAMQEDLVDDKIIAKAFSEYAKVPYIELSSHDINTDALKKIPERVARQYNAVLFRTDPDGTNYLAMDDPDDVQAVNFLQKQLGPNTKIYVAPTSNILTALESYHGDVAEKINEVISVQAVDEPKITEQQEEKITEQEISEDSPIAQTINLLIESAIRAHASDIHIEPREGYVQVRYRIDGILKEINRLPHNTMNALVSRIKILSNLKIDEHRVPQDGRFKINFGGRRFALRVSTMPVSDGEKVVIRILDESDQALSLEALGYWGQALNVLKKSIAEPNGMVLMTGPTGSGKSTSLFSVLTMLNTPSVNIATVEDPIEYRIPGVNQTQTNAKAGMTFANGLRAMLRQDPNIIMVGEIRDVETADLAIQAALTGHLVFSTLHTNNAATSLPRLLDMKIEPFLIASTMRSIVGQRLVRCVRKETRKKAVPTAEEKEMILQLFNLQPGQDMRFIHELEKQAAANGIGGDTPLSTTETDITTIWKADQNDTGAGAQNGYEGRVGIYEVLDNTPNIQKLIMANATSEQIQNQATRDGMLTMRTDGLIKALRGVTTLEEVIRVTRD